MGVGVVGEPSFVSVGKSGSVMAWGGRFSSSPDERMQAFQASIGFDVRFWRQDIRGSVAHVRMLGRQGIIPAEDAATIEDGLWTVWDELEAGTLSFSLADEDIHTGVENRLRQLIGPVSGKLHTGRSRNDQVANDFRFWTKDALLRLIAGAIDLIDALVAVAEQNKDTIMPGYTHTQRAQPVLLAHHLLAYVSMFERDIDRLRETLRRTDVLVLGSAALAGSTYPIDQEFVREDLDFAEIVMNSMDGVSDRDFVIDALFACSQLMMHISRLSEELIFWSSGEARYLTLDDAFTTGSSIMPQKKNADVAELGRGKAGRVFGHLLGMLTTSKGLVLAYNKDLQEDKEGLFDSVDTCLMVLDVFPPMLRTAKFNADKMLEAATADYSLATDVADLLARHGIPFREAHEVVGKLVATCSARGIGFDELTEAEWEAAHPIFATYKPAMTAWESVSARDVIGGTAPQRVHPAIAAAADRAKAERAWLEGARARYDRVLSRHSVGAGI